MNKPLLSFLILPVIAGIFSIPVFAERIVPASVIGGNGSGGSNVVDGVLGSLSDPYWHCQGGNDCYLDFELNEAVVISKLRVYPLSTMNYNDCSLGEINPTGIWVIQFKNFGGLYPTYRDRLPDNVQQAYHQRYRFVCNSWPPVDISEIQFFSNTPIGWEKTGVGSATNGTIRVFGTKATGALASAVPVGFGVLITSTLLFKGLAWFKGIAGMRS